MIRHAVVLLSVLISNSFGEECQLGFLHYQDFCYAVLPVQVTWAEALQICESMGSKLALIESGEEEMFVKGYLTRLHDSLPTNEIWLGGSDMLKEGQWRWADSLEPFTYTNWGPGEPDNIGSHGQGAHCLGLFRNHQFLWDDDNCETKSLPLCRHSVFPDESNSIIG